MQLYWKEAPTQVFSPEYCEIFKNSLLYRKPLVAVSDNNLVVTNLSFNKEEYNFHEFNGGKN